MHALELHRSQRTFRVQSRPEVLFSTYVKRNSAGGCHFLKVCFEYSCPLDHVQAPQQSPSTLPEWAPQRR